jgi:Xaa-Pro aminopeptidase
VKPDFTSEFFAGNRARLRSGLDKDYPIIMTANGEVQRAGDSSFPFRQDSNFWYLSGIETPEVLLVMTPTEEFIILPEREAIADVFDGAVDKQKLAETSGIATVYAQHEGWERLMALAKDHATFYAPLHKAYDEHHNLYLNPAKARLLSRLKKLEVELKDVRRPLVHLRMIKQPVEIAAIQQAIDITIDSFEATFSKGWSTQHPTETSVDAQLLYEFTKRGGKPAYPSIVAGGKRACTLHYIDNNQPINTSELLLIDAGAEWSNYASDITRVFTPKKTSAQQQAVYTAVKDAQTYAISLLKPGVNLRTIQKKTASHIGKFLKSQKLITKQEPNQIYAYYPHAVSHHLGLDVHDAADYSVALAEGMVITVEPGIYIPEWSVGVRIEDDILITKDGAKVLSASLPS